MITLKDYVDQLCYAIWQEYNCLRLIANCASAVSCNGYRAILSNHLLSQELPTISGMEKEFGCCEATKNPYCLWPEQCVSMQVAFLIQLQDTPSCCADFCGIWDLWYLQTCALKVDADAQKAMQSLEMRPSCITWHHHSTCAHLPTYVHWKWMQMLRKACRF